MTKHEANERRIASIAERLGYGEVSDEDRAWMLKRVLTMPRVATYAALAFCAFITSVGLYSNEFSSRTSALTAFVILATLFAAPLAFLWARNGRRLRRLLSAPLLQEARIEKIVEYSMRGAPGWKVDFVVHSEGGASQRLRGEFVAPFSQSVGDVLPLLTSADPRVDVNLILATAHAPVAALPRD